jgi:hypothetical protein
MILSSHKPGTLGIKVLQKQILAELFKILFGAFDRTRGFIEFLQEHATVPYSEIDESNILYPVRYAPCYFSQLKLGPPCYLSWFSA